MIINEYFRLFSGVKQSEVMVWLRMKPCNNVYYLPKISCEKIRRKKIRTTISNFSEKKNSAGNNFGGINFGQHFSDQLSQKGVFLNKLRSLVNQNRREKFQ